MSQDCSFLNLKLDFQIHFFPNISVKTNKMKHLDQYDSIIPAFCSFQVVIRISSHSLLPLTSTSLGAEIGETRIRVEQFPPDNSIAKHFPKVSKFFTYFLTCILMINDAAKSSVIFSPACLQRRYAFPCQTLGSPLAPQIPEDRSEYYILHRFAQKKNQESQRQNSLHE